jgi:hypothetical protein
MMIRRIIVRKGRLLVCFNCRDQFVCFNNATASRQFV